MRDIWSFLLQTLTASGTAVLLLAVKAMFRDKLSPRWQFAVWGVLGLVLAVPAGFGGRYALVNWPLLIETAKSALTGEYGSLTQVYAPVPLPRLSMPEGFAAWLFWLYAAGVLFFLARYLIAYIRLRLALKRGRPADPALLAAVGERYQLPVCPAVEVEGLSSAFVCGVFRPVLALPAGEETDEKVLLHELLHFKHRDPAWGLVICLFRCIHWCNPLLWYCANLAGNDLESLCDQRVLERLEGEDRRDYGRILLSMANEKYARAPGTSSMANGGENIRRRIESIARFKRYPAGMALVSVCMALILAAPLLVGVKAQTLPRFGGVNAPVMMAAARTTYCTTYAGAFDTYAKAVLTGRFDYRAMCAPLEDQNDLAENYRTSAAQGQWSWLDDSWEGRINTADGYEIYNLTPDGEGYLGTLAVSLHNAPEGESWDGTVHSRWMAVQDLRAEKEGARWVIRPLGQIQAVQGDERSYGNFHLPARIYQAEAGDFTIRLFWQSTAHVNSQTVTSDWFGNYSAFDTTPLPGGEFGTAFTNTEARAYYTGSPEDKEKYTQIGFSTAPLQEGDPWPENLHGPGYSGNSGGGSSDGSDWGTKSLEPGWESPVFLCGGGSGGSGPGSWAFSPPDCYAAEFYLNREKPVRLTLTLTEEVWPYD